MAFVEPWMELGLCTMFCEPMWTKNPDQVSTEELRRMKRMCRICGVARSCADFVEHEGITSGFWAGTFRDAPESAMDGVA